MTISTEVQYSAYLKILDKVNTGVYFTDHNRNIMYWNESAAAITGFSAEEVVGRSCRDNILMHVDCDGKSLCCSDRCPLLKSIREEVELEDDVFLHHKEGHRVPIHVKTIPLYDDFGKNIGGVELFSQTHFENVDLQRLHELEAQVMLDHLTGLANRRHLTEILAARYENDLASRAPFYLMLLDVDRFKAVNDTYGHGCGDEVLKMVAKSIIHGIPARDIAARWGGEEFLVLFDSPKETDALKHAEQVLMSIRTSFLMKEDKPIKVSASAGLVCSDAYASYADALEAVDKLMYQSKENGRDQLTY